MSRLIRHEIGREPTPEELAGKLAMPVEKVRKILKIAKEPLSMDMPVGEEALAICRVRVYLELGPHRVAGGGSRCRNDTPGHCGHERGLCETGRQCNGASSSAA